MRAALWQVPRPLRLAVLLTVLLSACWAAVSPLGSVPDEPQHVIYAAAVVRGELGTGANGIAVRVPADVGSVELKTCYKFRPEVTANCALPVPDVTGEAEVLTGAARYPPPYYVLVGWPTWFGFGDGAWYVMRMLSVLLGGALLWAAALSWRGLVPSAGLVPAAGLIAATSPMTGFLLGSVNPNGPEIVAACALVLAGAGTLRHWVDGGRVPRAATAGVVVSGGYLAVARPSTYVLTVALTLVLLVVAAGAWRRARPSWRPLVPSAVGLVLCTLGALLYSRASARPSVEVVDAISWQDAVVRAVAGAPGLLLETGGIFGWRDHVAPLHLRIAVVGLGAAVVLAGWFCATWWERSAIAVLAVGGLVAGPLFALLTVFRDGVGYQARYSMPLTQALVVLGACLVAGRAGRSPDEPGARALASLPVAVVVLHVLLLGGSWLRYAVGLPLPLDPRILPLVEWTPPAWPLVLVVIAASAVVAVRLAGLVRGSTGHAPEPLAQHRAAPAPP